MSQRRLTLIFGGGILLPVCGWTLLYSLNSYCHYELTGQCHQLWILAGISIIGTIIIIETALKRHFKDKHIVRTDIVKVPVEPDSDQGENKWRRAMVKSVARLTLGAILAALPLLMRGVIGVTGFSIFVGLSADFFIRGVMNWLPTKQDSAPG